MSDDEPAGSGEFAGSDGEVEDDGDEEISGSHGNAGDGTDDGAPIPTGCGPVDDLLGGGLERGTVTQVYGPPAAGKTNLALSAAVEVAASGGRALYVDTEGLSVERFHQLLGSRVDSVDDAAERIVVSAAHDFDEQEEAVRDAEQLAPQVELIVLDSATGFYRLERTDDDGEVLRQLARQVTHLLSLARRHDLAVLLTNQVYSDPDSESDASRPLGGHTLEHWTGAVVRLDRFRGGRRRATLRKHRSRAAGETAAFEITGEGLAGVEEP